MPCYEFITLQNMSFNTIQENKFAQKFQDLQYPLWLDAVCSLITSMFKTSDQKIQL